MTTTSAARAAFFEAVRASDDETVQRLLADDPSLANARWLGRAGDGKMRSLGPPPFNQHTWLTISAGHDTNDPRFTVRRSSTHATIESSASWWTPAPM